MEKHFWAAAWGDRVTVEVSPEMKYQVEIRAIEKGGDDESLDISAY